MNFTPITEDVLRRAGWTPYSDRRVPAPRSDAAFFPLHDAAETFLRQFHGLELSVPIDGCPDISGFVHFSPEHAFRFLSRNDAAMLATLVHRPVFPVGTTSGHTMFIFMDDTGGSYLLDMDRELFGELADTPAGAIEALCDGRNGRVDSHVLTDGAPSGHVIRATNERDYWSIEQFSGLADFLPAVSLSPARRPPTWRPMLSAARDSITQGNTPRERYHEIMVTPGGLFRADDGQMYYVSHCENSIYVRNRAGFALAGPPPGLSGVVKLRPGECVSFTPPSGWQ